MCSSRANMGKIGVLSYMGNRPSLSHCKYIDIV